MNERDRCGRCGNEDPRDLRMSLVNLAREAIQDGHPHTGPAYVNDIRCRDRDACRARAAVRYHPDGAA